MAEDINIGIFHCGIPEVLGVLVERQVTLAIQDETKIKIEVICPTDQKYEQFTTPIETEMMSHWPIEHILELISRKMRAWKESNFKLLVTSPIQLRARHDGIDQKDLIDIGGIKNKFTTISREIVKILEEFKVSFNKERILRLGDLDFIDKYPPDIQRHIYTKIAEMCTGIINE